MAEESRIRAARRVRGILLGFPPADRSLIVQLAQAEGKSSAETEEAPKRRGRKPGPKPKVGNGHDVPVAAGLKKDGTPKRKPGPRKKTEDAPSEAEVAETNAKVDAELGREQEVEQPSE